MKTSSLLNLGNVICNIVPEIRQDFVNVWQNTPYTIWSPCSGLRTALMLSNSVARCYNTTPYFTKISIRNFFTKMV